MKWILSEEKYISQFQFIKTSPESQFMITNLQGEEIKVKKYLRIVLCLSLAFLPVHLLLAQENAENGEDINIGKVVVKAKKSAVSHKLVITEDLKKKKIMGDPKNVMDLLKDYSFIDFRGATNLGPNNSIGSNGTYFLKGFTGLRFTTALDGVALIQTPLKQGGQKGSPNFSLIPPWSIESVEVIPGPHSALYPGKSIGGVINFITVSPKVYDSAKPEVNLSTSYGSYNTQNYNASISGGIGHFTYDGGYQYYTTDGYLRNSDGEIQNINGRLGYAFDNGGFIAVSVSDSRTTTGIPVNNYPGVSSDSSGATYDSDYPVVTGSSYYNWQKTKRDETYRKYSVNMKYPTILGTFSGGAYRTKRTREAEYYKTITDTTPYIMETTCRDRGGRIQDEIEFNKNHKTTISYDLALTYGGGGGAVTGTEKRNDIHGGAIQHEWRMFEPLTLTLGARYEHVTSYIRNHSSKPLPQYGDHITRKWDGIAPKSILKYEMDGISEWLRDTSLVLGVSRIWHAPDSVYYYNMRATPTALWVKEEHGVGVDFILTRRLFSAVYLNAGYSFSRINDYLVYNGDFAEYTPVTADSTLWYKDYEINVEAMDRHGVDIAMKGDIGKDLNLSISYSYQKFINQGDELAGEQAASDKAKHKAKAALRYQIIKGLFANIDYSFQSKQVATSYEEVATDVYEKTRTEMDAYQLVDVGFSYLFIDKQFGLESAELKIYVNNLLNEEYENAKGYPMTDRTYGCSLSMKI